MAWTAYQSVVRALQLCGAYAPGEPPSAPLGVIGLDTLNAMRSAWNLQGVICYGSISQAIPATGAASYSIPSGDAPTRPISILQVQHEDGSTPLVLDRRTFEEFGAISDGQTGTPAIWASNGAYPSESLYLFPRPITGTIRVFSRTPFNSIANLSDPIPDPPEYREAVDYGLAVRLAMIPGIGGGEPTSAMVAMAQDALRKIITRNALASVPRKSMPYVYSGTYDATGGHGGY